jgi:hypothetical protein
MTETGALWKMLLSPFHHPHLTSRNSIFETPTEKPLLQDDPHDPGRPGTFWFLPGCLENGVMGGLMRVMKCTSLPLPHGSL